MTALLWAVGIALWAGLVLWLRHYRIWLPYYLVAVAGSAAIIALLGGRELGLDQALAGVVAQQSHAFGMLLGLPTRTFAGAPGTLLVLVVDQQPGWTALQIGIESSGLLELGVLLSLLLWYPGWGWRQRLTLLTIGLIGTHLANVLRVLLISGLLHVYGKGALVLAHTFLGKALFFVCFIAILWRVLTAKTISALQAAPDG